MSIVFGSLTIYLTLYSRLSNLYFKVKIGYILLGLVGRTAEGCPDLIWIDSLAVAGVSNACGGPVWQPLQSILRRSQAIARRLYTAPFADTHGRSCRSVSAAMYSMFLPT